MKPQLFNQLKQRFEQTPPWVAIAVASVAASLLMQEAGGIFLAGIAVAAFIVLMALFSPWYGLLALFPMAFAIRPTPPSIGLQEAFFAVLLAVVFFGAVLKQLNNHGMGSLLRTFGWFVLSMCGLLAINLVVAHLNQVSLAEWLRGVAPFLFVLAFVPVAILLGHDRERHFWFGCSVAALIALMVGYVVVYYFANSLWQPYWNLTVYGEVLRVSEQVALDHPDSAYGPLLDRITMQVQRSTDAILPIGMVSGFVVAVLARGALGTLLGMCLSLISLAAILTTFTRSMLSSAVLVLGIFALFVLVYRRDRFLRMVWLTFCLGAAGLVFVLGTGMERVWIGRMGWLIESINTLFRIELSGVAPELSGVAPDKVDGNVSTRIEEYRIAWQMFLDNPLLGNGLGIKHEMRWETTEGKSLYQSVGYVHNWPLYILMVGGVAGLFAYFATLLGPVLSGLSSLRTESNARTIVRMVLLTMAVYGLFFAVFRLVTFNLILAAAWGYIYSRRVPKEIERTQ
jgi:hypothetical protein